MTRAISGAARKLLFRLPPPHTDTCAGSLCWHATYLHSIAWPSASGNMTSSMTSAVSTRRHARPQQLVCAGRMEQHRRGGRTNAVQGMRHAPRPCIPSPSAEISSAREQEEERITSHQLQAHPRLPRKPQIWPPRPRNAVREIEDLSFKIFSLRGAGAPYLTSS